MQHPLEKYRQIAIQKFVLQKEEGFYSDYYHKLSNDLYVDIDKSNDRLRVTGVDLAGKGFSEYISFSSYFLIQYADIESETLTRIDNIFLSHLDEKKQHVFINAIVAELQVLQSDITALTFDPKYEVYRSILIDKVNVFTQRLRQVYLSSSTHLTPKIQWLGNLNVLTTLIYDLWQGQEKGKSSSTKPFLKAQKKDLEIFLINNFIDAKGQHLSESTISDYLNTSKSEKRAKIGLRIELP